MFTPTNDNGINDVVVRHFVEYHGTSPVVYR
jgi:hypothetical protein